MGSFEIRITDTSILQLDTGSKFTRICYFKNFFKMGGFLIFRAGDLILFCDGGKMGVNFSLGQHLELGVVLRNHGNLNFSRLEIG